MKRETPYSRLLKAVRDYVLSVESPHKVTMWTYPKEKLTTAWSLADLHQRVAAANSLGYDVVLYDNESGLVVKYVMRPKEIDYPIYG